MAEHLVIRRYNGKYYQAEKDGSANATPTVNSNGADSNNGIVPGEVAINYRDGKLYYAKYNGSSYSRSPFSR